MTEELTAKELLEHEDELTKKKDNYLLIKFGYSASFVFKYVEGIEIIKHFLNAEAYEDNYSDPSIIKPIAEGDLSVKVISYDDYLMCKGMHLLRGQNAE